MKGKLKEWIFFILFFPLSPDMIIILHTFLLRFPWWHGATTTTMVARIVLQSLYYFTVGYTKEFGYLLRKNKLCELMKLKIGFKFAGRNGQPTSLSWSTRLKILKGTARGLAYIHECSPRKFVHGDIKPTNILVDNESQPYVSDFGLNRLITITGNNPSSGGLMGSALPYMKAVQTERANNYRAPEARVPGSRPTQKWDVYSFGVVLLELLTGKSPELSPTSTSTSLEVPDLVRWVRKGFEDENPLSDMVDPILLQEVHAKKEVLAAFHVALACTEPDPEVRPRMKTVSENLERVGS